ncbi:unnamed protein product, partial [Iphiclides podalirius]
MFGTKCTFTRFQQNENHDRRLVTPAPSIVHLWAHTFALDGSVDPGREAPKSRRRRQDNGASRDGPRSRRDAISAASEPVTFLAIPISTRVDTAASPLPEQLE